MGRPARLGVLDGDPGSQGISLLKCLAYVEEGAHPAWADRDGRLLRQQRYGTGKQPMIAPNADFEALKLLTRMQWMINFEAIATVPNGEDAIEIRARRKSLANRNSRLTPSS
jgi:hypothetical protein